MQCSGYFSPFIRGSLGLEILRNLDLGDKEHKKWEIPIYLNLSHRYVTCIYVGSSDRQDAINKPRTPATLEKGAQ